MPDVQSFLDHHPNPAIRDLLSKYMESEEGRLKIAHAMVHPARLSVEYYESILKGNLQSEEYAQNLQRHVVNLELFLNGVSEEEMGVEPYLELKGLLPQLKDLSQRVSSLVRNS